MNQFRAMQMNMDMMNSMYMCCVSACFEKLNGKRSVWIWNHDINIFWRTYHSGLQVRAGLRPRFVS